MKRILVAPLHWGLGHATRCIPIINALITHGFEPILATDGSALKLLKKEFPKLKAFELPSYNISYSKKGTNLKLKLLKDSPHVLKTIYREKKYVAKLVKTEKLDGIISDNRFGVRHAEIPSIYITHQLNVFSGKTTWLTSKLHQNIIKKFDECWIPDFENEPSLSRELGHLNQKFRNLKYIGPVSRFKKQTLETSIDLLVILSGPEPQRTLLENKLLTLLKTDNRTVIFIRGIIENQQKIEILGRITIYNFMTSKELETTINKSKLIISRPGYTSIMDLAKLSKKAIFIPTPGQFEQLYLAKVLDDNLVAPLVLQHELTENNLDVGKKYSGFKTFDSEINYESLFNLF